MFNRAEPRPSRERPASPSRLATGENAISIIGPGMRVEGDLVTDGTVRIEGTVHGTIKAGKAVVLGQGGEVIGDIVTRDAVIGGRVRGSLVVDNRLELQNSCTVDGEIRAPASHLHLEEGANFNGQIQMVDGDLKKQPAPAEVVVPVRKIAQLSTVS